MHSHCEWIYPLHNLDHTNVAREKQKHLTQHCKVKILNKSRVFSNAAGSLRSSLKNSYMREHEEKNTLTTRLSPPPRGLSYPIFSRVRHSGLQGGQRQGLPSHCAHHRPDTGGGEIHRRTGPLQPVAPEECQQGTAHSLYGNILQRFKHYCLSLYVLKYFMLENISVRCLVLRCS